MRAVTTRHVPVLLAEVIGALNVRPGGVYLDGTVGGGGHAEAILAASAPDGRLLGIDRDPAAISRTRRRLAAFGQRALLVHGAFADLGRHADAAGFGPFDGILLDLGFSSDQVDDATRGLSFRVDGPLDMRLDGGAAPGRPGAAGPCASDLVNGLSESALADLIYELGEERQSRRVARAIVAARPIGTTTELARVIAAAIGRGGGRIHPATRTFQALRIAVNDELGQLRVALPSAIDRLIAGGRLVVISFHSLEDRIVKQVLRDAARDCVCPPELPECRCDHVATLQHVPPRLIRPSEQEVRANPRARSAKLRCAERLASPVHARDPG